VATVFKRGGKSNRGGSYYVSWFDHNGKRQTKSARTTDKATAERIAAKYEADAALRRDGVIDPTVDKIGKESQRSIESHLADYEHKLKSARRDKNYIQTTLSYIRKVCDYADFFLACDITADPVNRFVSQLMDGGKSPRTAAAYITAVKGFTKWLNEEDKIVRDPLSGVKKPAAMRDSDRRMLLPDEWRWLHRITFGATTRHNMDGRDRALLYQAAIETGLRSNELRELSRGKLFFDTELPYVICKPRSTKNKKQAKQNLRRETAELLKLHVSAKTPTAPVFSLPSKYNMADMIRADLADARQAWLKQAKHDPEEYLRREQCDFLMEVNHEEE
jgi:site-specific recombinase XerC